MFQMLCNQIGIPFFLTVLLSIPLGSGFNGLERSRKTSKVIVGLCRQLSSIPLPMVVISEEGILCN
jgi:hypothetical protein